MGSQGIDQDGWQDLANDGAGYHRRRYSRDGRERRRFKKSNINRWRSAIWEYYAQHWYKRKIKGSLEEIRRSWALGSKLIRHANSLRKILTWYYSR